MPYLYLAAAIISEVIATTALKATNEFTRFWPSLLVITGYAAAFYFMTLTLRTFPVGIVYAVWAGAGIVLVTILGYFLYNQVIDLPAVIGITLIIAGVVVIQVFSGSVVH